MMGDERQLVPVVLWSEGLPQHEAKQVQIEIDSEDANDIALHTYIDEQGSLVSLYFDRETAIKVISLLTAAMVLR